MSVAKAKGAKSTKKKSTKVVKGVNAANETSRIKVGQASYIVTHYTFAMENDPLYANDALVDAKGLNEKHKEGFLFGPRGILMQGTGLASNGHYITIDWNKGGSKGRNTTFRYGTGVDPANLVPWKIVAADPREFKNGTRVEIELYKEKGVFTVRDTGSKVNGKHVDVFVGAVTIAEANVLGRKKSKVKKVD